MHIHFGAVLKRFGSFQNVLHGFQNVSTVTQEYTCTLAVTHRFGSFQNVLTVTQCFLEFNLLNKINGGSASGYSKAVGWNSHVTHTRTNNRCSS